MKIASSLSRHIILSMAAMAVGIMVLVIVGAYIFFAALFAISPASLSPPGNLLPSGPEWVWILTSTFAAVIIAVFTAIRLSRRILAPLNSVAQSLRKVAQGDLGARAATDDHSLGEAAQLVNDFNTMAEWLERMAQEHVFWNAAIAHELRTPVTILRGRLQGLTEGVFTPDETQFRSLLTQVEGLSRLIEDLRVVGLADSGHLDLRLEQTELSTEVGAVAHVFEPSLREAGFELTLDLQDQNVRCDPMRIRQALLALLENVLRHADPGRVRVRTRVDRGSCSLQVEDSGPGIPEEFAAHIFEAFQRGERSRSRKGGGSGLGLAVVQAIARAHGGRVICRPSSQGGTVFELTWPA